MLLKPCSITATWEIKYEEFRKRIHAIALQCHILGDVDFYKDCQHLDIIIKRDKPTANEIWFVIGVCKHQDEYARFFVEYLAKLSDGNAPAVADIFLKMLSTTKPLCPEAMIRSIVEKLFQAGLKEKANQICNAYFGGAPNLLSLLQMKSLQKKQRNLAHGNELSRK